MSKIIRKTFDVHNPPPLTKEQKTRLNKLTTITDDEIDCSDIPELNINDWKHAVPNPFFKIKKQVITSKIDNDVLNWLKSHGKGYQTFMNNLLRKAMINDLQNSH